MRLTVVTSALAAALACVAPVQWSGPAREPPRVLYQGPHGVPRAFGGGVCPLESAHRHGYPPVPRQAFVEGTSGARDARPLYAYFGTHPHHGRTCFHEGLHLHLEPPSLGMRWDAAHSAFAVHGAPLEEHAGLHPALPCEEGRKEPCTFDRPHAHAVCVERPSSLGDAHPRDVGSPGVSPSPP